jgi:hypothetical protein
MLKWLSANGVALLIAASPAIAGGSFTLPLNRMPPLQVGDTTFMSAVEYTSVGSVPGILVQLTGGYSPPPQSGGPTPVPAWSYNVQLFKDGDEFPIDGVIQVVKVSNSAKCGCITFSDTNKKTSAQGGKTVLVTDQPGFNTTIYGRSLINSEGIPDVYVRLSSIDVHTGERQAELVFYAKQKTVRPGSSYAGDKTVDEAPGSQGRVFVKEGGKVSFPYVGTYQLDSIMPADRGHGAWVILVPVSGA